MYSLGGHGRMIADSVRTHAYAAALRTCVRPGSVVLDIGTGTGIFALLACQAGARQVYAIEPDGIIHLARETATENGYADRIEFIQGVSSQITLPEPVDVIVSDLRGVLPLFQQHLPSIIDARQRFLAPGGTLIPRRDDIWAALVDAPDIYNGHVGAWNGNGFGFRLESSQRLATNFAQKAHFTTGQVLAEPQKWATLDYSTLVTTGCCGQLAWTMSRPGTGHGLSVWFDSVLADGVHLSNAPGAPELIYGSAFFPWSRPIELAVGDIVSVTLHANLVGSDYIWRWNTDVMSGAEPGVRKAEFRQSTFYGSPKTPSALRRCAANHRPAVSEDGEIDRLILTLMDGNTSLKDIAGHVIGRFPARFADQSAALTRIGELSQKYSL